MTAPFIRIYKRARPLVAALFVLAMIVAEPASTFAQMRASRSAAVGHGAVIAQGVAALPGPVLSWRVAGGEALPAPDAKAGPYPLGFVVATRGGLMIDQPGTGDRVELLAGEAAFSPPDREERRIGAGPDPVPYLRVELTAAEQAEDAGGDPVFYAGAPMPAPSGAEFDLELVRAALAREQEYALPAGLAPTLVMVYDGSVSVEPENGRVIEMKTGDIVEIDGGARITGAGRNIGVVLAARIAAEAPSRPESDAAGATTNEPATPPPPAEPNAPLATPVAPNAGANDGAPAMAVLPPGIDTNVTYPIEPAPSAPVARAVSPEIVPVTPETKPAPSAGKNADRPAGSGDQRRQTRDQESKNQRPSPKPDKQEPLAPKPDHAMTPNDTRVSTTPHAGGRGHAADRTDRRAGDNPQAAMETDPAAFDSTSPNDVSSPPESPRDTRTDDRQADRPERRGGQVGAPTPAESPAAAAGDLAPAPQTAPQTAPEASERSASRAKRANGSVALTATICPVGALPAEFSRLCAQPLNDVSFTLFGPGFADRAVLGGQSGKIRFTDLPRGNYRLAADLPGDFATSYATCSAPGGADVAERLGQNEFGFPVAGNNIACAWRVVPDDARGEGSGTGVGSLTIAVRACPAGATPRDFEPGSCLPAGAAPTLRLVRAQRIVLEPTAASTDLATWQNLEPGEYVLLTDALPEPYRQASLGGQGTAEGPHHFQITPDLRDTTLTLFLFAPATSDASASEPTAPVPAAPADSPAALPTGGTPPTTDIVGPPAAPDAPKPPMPAAPETATPASRTAQPPPPPPAPGAAAATAPDAGMPGLGLPGHTLIVAAYACPPGLPLARVNPERCAPAGVEAPLTLTQRRQGEIAPTNVSQGSGLTTWTGLPAGGYALEIAALPAPFTSASIAGEPWSAGKNTVRLWVGPGSKTTIVQLLLFTDDAATTPPVATPDVAAAPAGSVPPGREMAPNHPTSERHARPEGDKPAGHEHHSAARKHAAAGPSVGIWDVAAEAHQERTGASRLETRSEKRAGRDHRQPAANGCMIPGHGTGGGHGNEVRAQESEPGSQ